MFDLAHLPDKAPEYDLRELLEAGCHFGHQKRKWHPKMREWIYMEKDGVHIFDLAKTAQQLRHAHNVLHDLASKGKTVVIVGTKRPAREIVTEAAKETGMLSITSRWLGGLLTNWEQVRKSIRRMNEIEEGLESGAYKGYTKFERVQLEKERARLERFFGGIRTLKNRPDCLLIIDPNREKIAVKEAREMGIPVIAMIDTNGDPEFLDLVVPANDDAMSSIAYIMKQMVAGYLSGKGGAKPAAAAQPIPASTPAQPTKATHSDDAQQPASVPVEAKPAVAAKAKKTEPAAAPTKSAPKSESKKAESKAEPEKAVKKPAKKAVKKTSEEK